MTEIGVFSDSHGSRRKLTQLMELLTDCKYIVFLGDGLREVEDYTSEKLITVAGNCDYFSYASGRYIKQIEDVLVYITHGDGEGVKRGLSDLARHAKDNSCALALYGHTHEARTDTVNDVMCVNPGALKDGCYARLHIDGNNISVSLLSL